MPKGILFFADRLPPLIGGMEMHARYFIDYFRHHSRFPLLAIVSKDAEDSDMLVWEDTQEVIEMKYFSQHVKPDFLFFNSGRWIEEIDILKDMFPEAKLIYRTGGNEILKAPLVRNNHPEHDLRQKYWKDALNRNIDLMITNSAYTEARLHKLGIETPFFCCVGGVNTDVLKGTKRSLQGPITIFCAARFVPYKNHVLLLSVIHQLYLRGYQVRLKLAGDGPLLEKTKEHARNLDIQSIVEFLGVLVNEEVCREIAQADIYMQFSNDQLTKVTGGSYIHSECMGRSILEALAAGTYVIACRSGALDEIVTPERGLLVDFDDHVVITDKIENIFRTLPERPSFCEDYAWTKIFKRYEEIYETLARD